MVAGYLGSLAVMDTAPTMQPFTMDAGARVLIGSPATPMPEAISRALARLAHSLPAVLEAHLPQCFAPNSMKIPAQVLVLVIEPGSEESTINAVGDSLPTILPAGTPLDVWTLKPGDKFLGAVRGARCCLKEPDRGHRWWRFWKSNDG